MSAPLAPFGLPPALLDSKSQTQESLVSSHNLLHLLHHRNKNQHRRSTWYRHFSLLRRHVKHLCLELGIELGVGFRRRWGDGVAASKESKQRGAKQHGRSTSSSHSAPANKQTQNGKRGMYAAKQNTAALRQKASERVEFWMKHGLIERWYTAFTSLITTPSSSPLALTLLGVLARICSLTGVTARLELVAENDRDNADMNTLSSDGEDEEELARALRKFERVDAPGLFNTDGDKGHEGVLKRRPDTKAERAEDDVGVTVSRDEIGPASASGGLNVVTEAERPEDPPAGRVKKKRKKGNVIDDLFAGLS